VAAATAAIVQDDESEDCLTINVWVPPLALSKKGEIFASLFSFTHCRKTTCHGFHSWWRFYPWLELQPNNEVGKSRFLKK
jgi:hypothetical protein